MKRMQKEFKLVKKPQALKGFEAGKYVCFQPWGQTEIFFHKSYQQDQTHIEEVIRTLNRGIWWLQV